MFRIIINNENEKENGVLDSGLCFFSLPWDGFKTYSLKN